LSVIDVPVVTVVIGVDVTPLLFTPPPLPVTDGLGSEVGDDTAGGATVVGWVLVLLYREQ